jgi:hypothetical protein
MKDYGKHEAAHYDRLATIAQLLLDHFSEQRGEGYAQLPTIDEAQRTRFLRLAERAIGSVNPAVMIVAADAAAQEVDEWFKENPRAKPSQIANEAIHRYEALVTA